MKKKKFKKIIICGNDFEKKCLMNKKISYSNLMRNMNK